jgi:hypothetical protein
MGFPFPRKLRIYDLQTQNIKPITYEYQLGKAGYKKNTKNEKYTSQERKDKTKEKYR